MRSLKFAFILLAATFASENTYAATDCGGVLVPTVEQANSEYTMLQAYMRINAAEEYDRLKAMESSGREAQASYKLFSAEYGDSRNKEEFREKTNKRLEREGFNLSISESKAAHRRFLTEAQISGWTKCVASQAHGGSVLLQARDISKDGFPLRIDWIPQKGLGEGTLSLSLAGGAIAGESKLTVKLSGANTLSYIVIPEVNKEKVIVAANIEGNADDITVSLTPLASRQVTIIETNSKLLHLEDINCYRLAGDGPCDFWVTWEEPPSGMQSIIRVGENNEGYFACGGKIVDGRLKKHAPWATPKGITKLRYFQVPATPPNYGCTPEIPKELPAAESSISVK